MGRYAKSSDPNPVSSCNPYACEIMFDNLLGPVLLYELGFQISVLMSFCPGKNSLCRSPPSQFQLEPPFQSHPPFPYPTPLLKYSRCPAPPACKQTALFLEHQTEGWIWGRYPTSVVKRQKEGLVLHSVNMPISLNCRVIIFTQPREENPEMLK